MHTRRARAARRRSRRPYPRPHAFVRSYRTKFIDAFFAEAARVGQAPRISKRARVAPTFADEEPSRKRLNPSGATARTGWRGAAKASEKEKQERAAARAARAAESAAAVAAAERKVQLARRRLREVEEELRGAERVLEGSKREAEKVQASLADEEAADEAEVEAEEDETSGVAFPTGTVLWSHKVKCEHGVRVFAQQGDDDDGLWFRGTVTGVKRDELGQYVDVAYDNGTVEKGKPIRRVRALDFPDSDSEEESEDEEDDDE